MNKQSNQVENDLAMLVRMLSRALAKAAPASTLPGRATEYLQRKGLAGSPLREGVVPGEEWKIERDAAARRDAAEFSRDLDAKLNRALPAAAPAIEKGLSK